MGPPKTTLDDLRIERKPKSSSRSGTWLAIIIVVAVAVIPAGRWLTRPKALQVRTVLAREAATTGTERTVLNASGYVTARRAATVSSKVTGKVTEVLIEEGMKVEEGQILARLDDTNVKASLRLAQAQLESATKSLEETRVRIKEADGELRRISDLVKNRIATQADLDHAEAAASSLKAKLEQQQADVTVADRQVASWQQ